MKNAASALLVVIFAALALVAAFYFGKSAAHPTTFTAGPPLIHLEKMGELAVVKVQVADVLVGENDAYKGSWLVKGDALLTVDMERAKLQVTDEKNHKAQILLPLPQVKHPRVDHEKSRTWSVEKNSWVKWAWTSPDPLRDQAMQQAQRLVEFSAHSQDSLDLAQSQATILLQKLYTPLGWDITIQWLPDQPATTKP